MFFDVAKPPRSQMDWAHSHGNKRAGDAFSGQYSLGSHHKDKYSTMPGPPGLHALNSLTSLHLILPQLLFCHDWCINTCFGIIVTKTGACYG